MVIIGVLAALVIPRMMAQIEKAKMVEAFHMIGALQRAEQAYMDLTGSTQYLYANTFGSEANFAKLGVQTPADTNFEYDCVWDGGANICLAFRQPVGTFWGAGDSQIGLYDDKTWYCGGVLYTAGATSGDACVLK